MAETSAISVIVPVYNVEQYLGRCLRSLTDQTALARMEIVLVDDGSTDGGGRMCDEFANSRPDVRVKVVHQKNGGLSAARNSGMRVASGEYFLFVDSDDFIRRDAVEIVLKYLDEGAEGVFLRLANVYGDEEVSAPDAPETLFLEGPEVHRALLLHTYGILENAPKAYRRDIVGDTRFPVGAVCEDVPFLFHVLCRLRRAVIPAPALYFYRLRHGSIMHTLRPELLDERVSVHEEAERLTVQTWPELREVAQARTLYMRLFILNDMMDCPGMGDKACFRRHIKALRGQLGALLKNGERRWLPPSRKVYAVLLCLCPPLARLLHRRRAGRGKGAA